MTARHRQAADSGAPQLAEFAASHGVPVQAAANAPVELEDAGSVWYVVQGALDVFCSEHDDDRITAAAKHLLRAGEGRLVFGLPRLAGSLSVVGKGLADTKLLRLDASALGTPQSDDISDRGSASGMPPPGPGTPQSDEVADMRGEVAQQAEAWVSDIARAVAADIESHPRATTLIAADAAPATTVDADSVVAAHQSDVVWVSAPQGEGTAALAYLSTEAVPSGADDRPRWVPLTSQSWATVSHHPQPPPPPIPRGQRGALWGGRRTSRLRCVADGAQRIARSARRFSPHGVQRRGAQPEAPAR